MTKNNYRNENVKYVICQKKPPKVFNYLFYFDFFEQGEVK